MTTTLPSQANQFCDDMHALFVKGYVVCEPGQDLCLNASLGPRQTLAQIALDSATRKELPEDSATRADVLAVLDKFASYDAFNIAFNEPSDKTPLATVSEDLL